MVVSPWLGPKTNYSYIERKRSLWNTDARVDQEQIVFQASFNNPKENVDALAGR